MNEKEAPQNDVSGPFYVQKACCLSCGVPQMIAPELFTWDEENDCKFKRQPKTKDEIDNAVRVIAAQEVGCIRYGGDDPELLLRIAELGEQEQCDVKSPSSMERMFRNHVTFKSVQITAGFTALNLLDRLKSYLRSENERVLESLASVLSAEKLKEIEYRFSETKESNGNATFSYSWSESHHHAVEIVELPEEECKWLIRHLPADAVDSLSVSCAIHDWLIADGSFRSIRWYPSSDWKNESQWRKTPW